MFRNPNGRVLTDAEALFENIRCCSEQELSALDERKAILRDVMNSFSARLEALPERERNSVLSLLYKKITDTIFDFHLSIATHAARESIEQAKTREQKLQALREFRAITDDLALLYGVPT